MKFYTRLGDDGTTSLYGGRRVPKDNQRIEVSGEIDELNAHVGVLAANICTCVACHGESGVVDMLAEIQARLFIIGSSLSSAGVKGTWRVGKDLQGDGRLGSDELQRIEDEIDRLQAIVPEVDTFVLPGGGVAAALAHVCRTVCRRVERRLVSLGRTEHVDAVVMQFVNRLSDYFFVLALYLNFIEGCSEKKLYITCK